jgi:internalin A
LSVVGTKITEGGLSKLKRAIPRCVIKTDAGTADVVDSELKARAELERIGARIRLDEKGDVQAVSLNKGTIFTDKELAHIKWMIDLRQLSLNGANVSDEGLVHLAGLTKLEVLDLCNTKISDAWREAMPELPKLAWLDVRGTKITDSGLRRLADLPSLKNLFLSGPKITNTGLEHLGKITSLEHLSLTLCRGVSNSGLLYLRGLYRLKRLDLRGTSVLEDGANQLQRFLPNCAMQRD